jgi:hypothetical protein
VTTIDRLLSVLDGVRKSGRGYIAKCPAHEDRSASLSIAEGHDGRVLLKCFAGCSISEILRALGLEIAALFPVRLVDTSPAGKAAAREAWQHAGWRAALVVLAREASIVSIAAREIAVGRVPSVEDCARLTLAIQRIDDVRQILAP